MGDRVWVAHDLGRDAETEARSRALAAELGVPPLVARVLCRRGLAEPGQARAFLEPDLRDLSDPFLLPDMAGAVSRIVKAVTSHEKVRVFGDYDVDGVTAVSVLLHVLRRLGVDVDYYIPARLSEGYGVNADAVARAADEGIGLLITVDCGTTSVREVGLARERGLDVIVTDHHEPGDELPSAVAVVNPKRRDARYPFPDLAGVGVAYKLACAVLAAREGTLDALEPDPYLLELVALGTIADVAPLLGENRVFAKHGLARMNRTTRVGLRALIERAGLLGREITAGAVSFALAPRLNAAGRLQDASLCVDLLTTDSPDRAAEIAGILERANRERQALEQSILDEAAAMVESEGGCAGDPVLVVAGEGWHAGVIGIVAARMVERFCRPAILISLDGEQGRGSGRSVEAFDLYEGLRSCADLLSSFGGHRHAAGLAIPRAAIDEFRARINELGKDILSPADLTRKIACDVEVGFDEIDLAAAEGLAALAPFGAGNPAPVFVTRGARLVEYRGVGSEARHLKMRLANRGVVLDAIGFGLGDMATTFFARRVTEVDVAYMVDVNQWNGSRRVELIVKDAKEAAGPA